MNARSRTKGANFEREVARILRDHDIPVVRTGEYKKDDLLVCLDGTERVWECKRRKKGFHSLYSFISGAWAVVHRDDHQEPLITLRLDDFLTLRGRS